MDWKLDWRLALCVLGPLCAGCAASPDVIRGQSPGMAPQPQSMVYNATYDQSEQMGGPGCEGACPECGCTDGTCSHCCLGHLPQHRLYYHYCDPHNRPERLVYPPNPSPAAVVQYPYYTCKGPDDFFLQR